MCGRVRVSCYERKKKAFFSTLLSRELMGKNAMGFLLFLALSLALLMSTAPGLHSSAVTSQNLQDISCSVVPNFLFLRPL